MTNNFQIFITTTKTNKVRVRRNNNNGILIEVTKTSGAFAKQCAQSFNDLPIMIRSGVPLSFDKVKVKQYLLGKALAKHFTE